jgi:hypothetical protein
MIATTARHLFRSVQIDRLLMAIQSQLAHVLFGELDEFFHLVLPVLTVVVLEIEVFGHELVQPHHVHQVVQVVPLLTVLLVTLLLLQGREGTLAVAPHQGSQGIRTRLGKLLIGVHLEPHNHLLLQQEVLDVLESVTVDEDLPAGQLVDVLFVFDGLLQTLVVLPCDSQHLTNDR